MILTVCPNPSIDTYSWLDDFTSGGVNRISRQKEYPGGKGIHVAMAIQEIGGDTSLLGGWAGSTGDWLKKECEFMGLVTLGPEMKGSNRKCYTFRSENAEFNNSELLEPGPEMSEQDFSSFVEIFDSNLQSSSLVVISGSWPKKAPLDAYRQLVDKTSEKNKKAIVDCSGEQLENVLKCDSIFGIHLNEDEALAQFGSTEIEKVIHKIGDKISLIALTKGSKGLWLYYNGRVVHANVKIDKVISTVGSGDCLTAGIAYAVSKEMAIEDVARYGVACGAANCLNEDLGMLKKADVDSLISKVTVKNYEYAK